MLVMPLGSIIPVRFAQLLKALSSIPVNVLPERSRLTNLLLLLLSLKIAPTLPEVVELPPRLPTLSLTAYAAVVVLPGKPDKYVSKSATVLKVAVVIERVLVCAELYAQVSVSIPTCDVLGGVVTVQLLLQLCAFGSIAMGRVSLCVASWVQVPVSTPAVIQVAGVVVTHA